MPVRGVIKDLTYALATVFDKLPGLDRSFFQRDDSLRHAGGELQGYDNAPGQW